MAFVVLGLIVLVVPSEDSEEPEATRTVTTVPEPQETSTVTETQTTAADTIMDARAAVDDDQYSGALAIAAVLGADAEVVIRRRIANRLARRARAALSRGDRRAASTLLRQAESYPQTVALVGARSSLQAAQDQAADRAAARRLAAAQREAAREAAQEAERETQPEPEPASNCDPNYSGCVPPYPPDVDCPDLSGSVTVTGSDPHGLDRDGDGVGCE